MIDSDDFTQHVDRDWSGFLIIEYDPQTLGGAPTVRGRRITPDNFVESFNAGQNYTPEYIFGEFFEEAGGGCARSSSLRREA